MEIYDNDENNSRLKEIFSEVGKKYGYDSVNAEFMAFREFKCRWQRTYGWADFRVSDYLDDAPANVLESLAESLFKRITGKDDTFSPELRTWVTDPSFHALKQDVYLSRCPNFTRSPVGECKNLQESYDRLIGAGLVPYDPSVVLTWTKEPYSHRAGNCSVLMRVVSITSALDADEVPDFVLDYCLYHQLCHMIVGFDPDSEAHEEQYNRLENKFPEKPEAKYWLRKLCAYV